MPGLRVNKEMVRVGTEMIFLETKEVFISPRSFVELNLSLDLFFLPNAAREGLGAGTMKN